MMRPPHFARFALLALSLGFAAGCVPELDDAAAHLTFDGDGGAGCDPEALLAERCGQSVCHDDTNPASALDLRTPGAIDRMRNVPSNDCEGHTLVVEGDWQQSLFFRKLVAPPAACGLRMPFTGEPLDPDELRCIAAYIGATP